MRRVLIIGCGGAGKSTLAVELGRRLDLPVIHLDAVFWRPGWVATPDHEFDTVVQKLTLGEEWIMDGNFGRTLPIRLAAADTAVFLDFPTLTCLRRVLARRFRYRGKTRPDMAPGCLESFDLEFLRWILQFRRKSRPQVLARLAENSHVRAVILRNPAQVRRYLAGVSDGQPNAGA